MPIGRLTCGRQPETIGRAITGFISRLHWFKDLATVCLPSGCTPSRMPGIPILPHDQIVSVVFTSALFGGIYLSTFVQSLRGLLFTPRRWELRPANSIQWPILIVSLSIFALSVVDHTTQVISRGQETLTTPPAVHITDWKDVVVVSMSILFHNFICCKPVDTHSARPQIWLPSSRTLSLYVAQLASIHNLLKIYRCSVSGKFTITHIAS